MKNILRVFAVMIAMLVSLVFITVKTIAPDYGFDLAVDGVESEVEVLFDDIGVPHILSLIHI